MHSHYGPGVLVLDHFLPYLSGLVELGSILLHTLDLRRNAERQQRHDESNEQRISHFRTLGLLRQRIVRNPSDRAMVLRFFTVISGSLASFRNRDCDQDITLKTPAAGSISAIEILRQHPNINHLRFNQKLAFAHCSSRSEVNAKGRVE